MSNETTYAIATSLVTIALIVIPLRFAFLWQINRWRNGQLARIEAFRLEYGPQADDLCKRLKRELHESYSKQVRILLSKPQEQVQ